MKRVRHVPTIANRVGAGFALILFFMAVLIFIAYGDMRAAQAQADIDSNSLLFGVMAGGFMIVGIFLAIHLRNGLLWRSQTVADMIYTLSRGNPLEEYTQEQIENLNPPILNSLRRVSDQLVAAKKMQQEEVVLQETATERTAQMHRFRGAVEQVFSKAAHGDFSARLTVPKDRPELSDFCDRINSFLSGIDDSFQSIKTTMELIASGKLHTKIEGENEGDFHVLQENINGTLGMLLEFMTDLKSASHSVSDATSRISNGSSLLAQQVDQQASSLSEASSLMDGISQSISRSAESVTQADTLTSKAANQADHGSNVVSDAISAMERIEGNSDRISDIISVIEGIAFQTNLLALNAAVEAARAGDAGKGFAVVASEVRNLAQRASDAAKDITDLIQQSSGDVEDGVRLVKQSGDVLHEIADAVRQVSDTMSELNVSGANQARGVGEVTETIKALDTANAQSVVLADEASQGSQVLKEESKRLSELVKRFSSEESQDQEWENAVSDLRERSTPSEDSRDSKEPEMPMSLLGIAQKSNLATDVSSEWEEF